MERVVSGQAEIHRHRCALRSNFAAVAGKRQNCQRRNIPSYRETGLFLRRERRCDVAIRYEVGLQPRCGWFFNARAAVSEFHCVSKLEWGRAIPLKLPGAKRRSELERPRLEQIQMLHARELAISNCNA